MSEPASDDFDDDLVLQDFRTSNSRFQQRLLEAQQVTNEKHVEAELAKKQQSPTEEEQNEEIEIVEEDIERLKNEIQATQAEVDGLKIELDEWRVRRHQEASITRLSTEERAQKPQQESALTPADLDSIFDYLLEMGQMPQNDNAAELEHSGILESNQSIQSKALAHVDVVAQQRFTNITFTKINNAFVENGNCQSSYRDCMLEGKAFDTPFSVTFRVDSTLELGNLDFDVDTDLQVDANTVLTRIKEECNLMAFFRLILHYGRLEDVKIKTFNYLASHYQDSQVETEQHDSSSMEFSTMLSDIRLRLSWSYVSVDLSQYDALDVNVSDYLVPDVRLLVTSEGHSTMLTTVLDKVPEKFYTLSDQIGVIQAAEIMVGSILQEPHQNHMES